MALCSHATFGQPQTEASQRMAAAVRLLESRGVDFEFEGELSPEVALDESLRRRYPFCRLTGSANVLVMPSLDAAQIATQMVARLGEARVIGPVLVGLDHPVQVVPADSKVSDLVVFACLAATTME